MSHLPAKASCNPTAARSRRWITEALMEIMREKPLCEITVNEICRRADLTRPTFYNHFASKDAVVESIMDDLLAQFVASLDGDRISSTEQMMRAYFAFWVERRELLSLFAENDLIPLMGDRLVPYLELIYLLIPFDKGDYSTQELGFHNAFLSSGMVGVLKSWAEGGLVESPEVLASYIDHTITVVHGGMRQSPAPSADAMTGI